MIVRYILIIISLIYVTNTLANDMEKKIGFDSKRVSEIKSLLKDDDLDYRDLTQSYIWLSSGRIIWINGKNSGNSKVVYIDEEGKFIFVSGEFSSINYISNKFIKQYDEKVGNYVVDLIGELYMYPANEIGSSKLLVKNERIVGGSKLMDGWTDGDKELEKKFIKYCKDPSFRINHDGRYWYGDFYVFNTGGGVNHVYVHGSVKPFEIKDVKIVTVENDETFLFPEMLL